MRVDFYQLQNAPVEHILPAIAHKLNDQQQKLLVVSTDEQELSRISAALWTQQRNSFLPHKIVEGDIDDPSGSGQPILLAGAISRVNGAKNIALADGEWRDDALEFERVFFLFPQAKIDGAREAWRALDGRDDTDLKFWKQQDGRWIEGP